MNKPQIGFQDVVTGLLAGDFSRLAPLFADNVSQAGKRCSIFKWLVACYDSGIGGTI